MSQRNSGGTVEVSPAGGAAKDDDDCPLTELFDLVSDKWVPQLLYELRDGPLRFTQLERAVPGISRRMLTLALRNLERNGLVARTVYPVVPPRVEYTRTPLGDRLHEPLAGLVAWVRQARPEVAAARRAYDERQAG